MRGALFIVVLIAMLIVGILVIKDYNAGPSGNTRQTKKVYVDKAEQAAKTANKVTNKTVNIIKQTAETD